MASVVEHWLIAPVFLASWAGTLLVYRYAARKLIDRPNSRSSHSSPVPRGGGLSAVLTFLMGALLLWWLDVLPTSLLLALSAGGGLVAAFGFWDDHVSLSALLRFAVHICAAALAVALLGPLQEVPMGAVTMIVPAWLAWPTSVIIVAWLVNLYNFMDGIDGIAASEAVSVSLAAGLIAVIVGTTLPGLFLLAAAAAGFLVLNWPPARIFMGDVGSGFLGYAFAVYLLFSANADARFLWVWVILLGVFWVDATVTLFRRMIAAERWYAPHRSHGYQHAATRISKHWPVTTAAVAINLLVLLPLAIVAAVRPEHAYLCAAVATTVLLLLAIALDAGRSKTATETD